MQADGTGLRRLTADASNEVVPSWSGDGRSIYNANDRLGEFSLWRQSLAGGNPELIQQRAFASAESADGKYVYYARGPNQPGLFRRLLSGGSEEPVIADLRSGMWGNWALGRHAVYFTDIETQPKFVSRLSRLDLASRNRQPLFLIPHAIGWDGALSISPGERWIVYSNLDRSGSDIFLARIGD